MLAAAIEQLVDGHPAPLVQANADGVRLVSQHEAQ
jgi:hypothetical protein